MATTVWTGRITFGLVSIPVRLYSAVRSHDIHFHYLHSEDHERVHMKYHCGKDDQELNRDDLVRGYEYKKGEYVIVDDEDLEAIEPRSSSNMDLLKFVDASELDPVYYEHSYYVGPDEGSDKSFALLTEAMEKKKKAAIGKLFMRDHEYLAYIRPANGGLILHTLLYADEVRKDEYKVKKGTEVREKEMHLAEQIIENLSDEFNIDEFKDEYRERLETMLDSKIKGKKVRKLKERPKRTIPNLLEALQHSVKQTEKLKKSA